MSSTLMLSVGQLIWVSVRPLIRLMICVGSGFAITKADIFPAVAARGTGQIALNIALPALMFSKIIPAFSSSNVHALGPLVLIALLYEGLGILIALVVKQFFWVPHRFRHGILVAGGWGNTGDIPTSVILSICGSAPFNGTEDQNLSVAYISAFNLVFMLTLFPLGGHRLISMDFEGPGVEDDEVREEMRKKRRAIVIGWIKFLRGCSPRTPQEINEGDLEEKCCPSSDCADKDEQDTTRPELAVPVPSLPRPALLHRHSSTIAPKHVSFDHEDGVSFTEAAGSRVYSPVATEIALSRVTSPTQTATHVESTVHADKSKEASSTTPPVPDPSQPNVSRLRRIWRKSEPIIRSIITPPSLSILISFPIALITPLKALFVPVANSHIPNGPDGLPPLSFLLDTANFIGGASVPLGLICLGGALARLKVPRSQWTSLPLGAISGLALGRLILSPILGVSICEAMTRAGIIDRNDKVLRLVCIFLSCLPTATTQVFLTQVYSGTGSAEHLSAFIIPQYILMLLSMTVLLVYTLHLLF